MRRYRVDERLRWRHEHGTIVGKPWKDWTVVEIRPTDKHGYRAEYTLAHCDRRSNARKIVKALNIIATAEEAETP